MTYSGLGYEDVRRWTQKDDIFTYDILRVPMQMNAHVTLAVIDIRRKGIKYMDSMGGQNDDCLAELLEYLVRELVDKKKSRLHTDE